jgi:uncharacterized protein DUF2795
MSIDDAISTDLDLDLAQLRAALARQPWPATQDDILAHLVARHAPARLMWRAAALDHGRTYDSADQVCDEIARFTDARMPPPPGR